MKSINFLISLHLTNLMNELDEIPPVSNAIRYEIWKNTNSYFNFFTPMSLRLEKSIDIKLLN